METIFAQLAVVVAIVAQTGIFASWLGRLSQRLQDVNEDVKMITASIVRREEYEAKHNNLERRVTQLESRFGSVAVPLRGYDDSSQGGQAQQG